MAQAHVERKLTAILSTDVVGFSRLMGQDDVRTAQALDISRNLIRTQVVQHGGRVVDAVGDNLLADFPSALEAVRCAVSVQQALASGSTPDSSKHRLLWRMGVNVGDVLIRGQEIAGDGVNIAARLEALAPPGGICISGTVYDQVEGKLALGYAFLGERSMKNIAKPQPETLDAQSDPYQQMEAAAMAHRNTLLSKFEALSSSGALLRKVAKVARYIWKNWGNF